MLPVAILIPAFQPSPSLLTLIEQLIQHVHSIILINDGSSSAHSKLFTKIKLYKQVHYIEHTQNQGKGAALKTGMLYWQQHLSTITKGIVTADADGQHSAQDILKLSNALIDTPSSIHLGVRQFSTSIPLRSHLGNVITRSLFRLLTGHNLLDTQTGLRCLPQEFIEKAIKLDGNGYEYEMKTLTYALKQQWPIKQHAIATIYIDDNSSSHFRPIYDSYRIYSCLIKTIFE